MAEEQKSWWQTAAGLMTAVAALVTAFTGLLVASHQIGKGGSDIGKAAITAQATSTPVSKAGSGFETHKSPDESASTHSPSPSERTGRLSDRLPGVVDAAVVEAGGHTVSLPSQHEFALGVGLQTARFILTGARLEPHTSESDTLKVSVQVLADGQQAFPFNDMQFELRIDEQPYKSQTHFSELISVGQSRDHDLHFTIPHGAGRAVLWIHERLSNAEVPLDLTPLR
jgi:hypothetical protein